MLHCAFRVQSPWISPWRLIAGKRLFKRKPFVWLSHVGPSAVQNSVRYEMWTLFIVPPQLYQSSSLNNYVFHLLFQYPFEENLFQSLFYPLQTKFLDTVNTLCGRIPQVFLKQIEKTMRAVYEKKVVRRVRLPHEKWVCISTA